MTDPVSVLLIIGAAVIGPIEAQPVTWNDNIHNYVQKEVCDMTPKEHKWPEPLNVPERGKYYPCSRSFPLSYETVAELCARIFREVGVYERWGRYWIEQKPVADELTRRTDDFRCIPTPAGYRR